MFMMIIENDPKNHLTVSVTKIQNLFFLTKLFRQKTVKMRFPIKSGRSVNPAVAAQLHHFLKAFNCGCLTL